MALDITPLGPTLIRGNVDVVAEDPPVDPPLAWFDHIFTLTSAATIKTT
jgi:hypothetical protein